jgi:hypothetical protein
MIESNNLSLVFLIVVAILFPIFNLLDIYTYFEFLIMSILIRSILAYLSPKRHSKVIFNFLNLAQGIYIVLIIIMWNYANNDLGILDISKLLGDSQKYYLESIIMSEAEGKSFLELGELSNINYFLFQYILSKIIFLFKSKYLAALMFVMFTGLINLLLLFKIGILLKFNKQTMQTIGVFYILFPHILSSNIILLKDSLITFSLLLLVYAAISFREKQNNIYKFAIYILISFFLITFLRLPFLIMFILILYFIYVKKSTSYSYIFLFLSVSSFLAYSIFYTQLSEIYEMGKLITENIANSEVHGSGFANILVGTYLSDPIYLKIIKLPLVVIVQYLTPFNVHQFYHFNPWSYIDVNMKIVWLVFFGPLFIFSSIQMRHLNYLIKKILLVSVVGYIFIAYMETGIVPRYALLFMCLSILPMAYIFQETKDNIILKRKYISFKKVYFFFSFSLAFFYIILKL